MPFDLKTWKADIKKQLSHLRESVQGYGIYSVYSFLATTTLWPVVQAFSSGDISALFALGNVLSGVGGGLLANNIQAWKDKADKRELGRELEKQIAENPALREELDTVLEKLGTLELARSVLPDADRQWFVETLQQELAELGNLPRFEAVLDGSVVISCSPGAVGAAGPGATAIGTVHGDVYLGPPAGDAGEALAIYRRTLVAACRHLPLRGVDISASDPTAGKQRLDMAQVYVALDTKTRVPLREEEKKRQKKAFPFEERDSRPLGALEATIENRRLVLLGDPGSGKSTFCNYLAVCLAAHAIEPESGWLERLPGWPRAEADLLPISVVLRDFAAWLPEKTKKAEVRHLWDFITHRLEAQNLAFAADPLHDHLERGKALLLLDGLDEIPARRQRRLIRDAVAVFSRRYAESRMLVTCRTLSYQDKDTDWQLESVPAFELAPFDKEKISHFVEAWYAELARVGEVESREAGRLAERLRRALQGRPDLQRLAPNPLLLTVMALVHTHKGRLPETRAVLYQEAVEMLLWRWEEKKSSDMPTLRRLLADAGRAEMDLQRKLWELAFEAHGRSGEAGGEGLADIGELQLEKALAALHPGKSRDWALQVIETMKMRAGLLLERRPEVYTFPHRTFQEYLAGAHLALQAGFARQARDLVGQGAYWREVVLLATGRLVHAQGDLDKPLALVAELCPSGAVRSDSDWRKVWLAGEVLDEMGLNRVEDRSLGRELAGRVRRRLAELLAGGHLQPVERASAGNTLAKLGDPRFRKDAWSLPDDPADAGLGFIEIPAGPFLMGSDKERDRNAIEKRECPQHTLELPGYYIARYPVTVAQFKAFVDATGYEPEDSRCLRGVANHPVVLVTWYDALKYCDWLTETLRQWDGTPEPLARLLREENWRITLPSEAEWEKAARGADGRIYPWGDDTDPNKANYEDTGIGSTSPVGCFPGGASPFVCQDMAGNVWEWTRSLWGKYPYPASREGRAERENLASGSGRVVRGGSWIGFALHCRCADRFSYTPTVRGDSAGFRLALVP